SFARIGGHTPPGNSVVVTSGDSFAVGAGPMGVELIVLTIANRLVARHRHRAAIELFQVNILPEPLAIHCCSPKLVCRCRNMDNGALNDHFIPPARRPPCSLESTLLKVSCLIPPLRKRRAPFSNSSAL